ncbi:MAG: hypothetical protein COA58_09915 [Bacteroidetes bacterium]|nr:MAG: hypothetical protein COA58_09915 [Bacteroidota bacterium]
MRKLLLFGSLFLFLNNYAISISSTAVTEGGNLGYQFEVTDPMYMPAFYFDGISYPPEGYSYFWHTDEGHVSSAEKPIFFFQTLGVHNVNIVITPRKKGDDDFKVFDTYSFTVAAGQISGASNGNIQDAPIYFTDPPKIGDKTYIVVPLNSCDVLGAPHSYGVGFNNTTLSYIGTLDQSNLTVGVTELLTDSEEGLPITDKIPFTYYWGELRNDIAVVMEFEVVAKPKDLAIVKFYKAEQAQCKESSYAIGSAFVGPYDPNFKESSVNQVNVHIDATKKLSPTSVDYTIHFQNIGTGPVDSITIIDNLPDYLTFDSFLETSVSSLLVTATNVGDQLKWVISPTADVRGTNESPSKAEIYTKGWVKFRAEIDPESGITYDTCYCLCNVAKIYFDDLDPIVTKADVIAIGDSLCFSRIKGTTTNITYADQMCFDTSKYYPTTLAVKDFFESNFNPVSIYPNPAIGLITINTEEGVVSNVIVMNQLGEKMTVPAITHNTYDIASLAQGTYIIQVEIGTKKYYSRIVKIY